MGTDNISAYDIGFLEGLGGISDSADVSLVFDRPDDVMGEIFNLIKLIPVCKVVDRDCTVDYPKEAYYLKRSNYIESKELSYDVRKFILGYLVSNAIITDKLEVALQFRDNDIFMIFNMLATPTSTTSVNSYKDPTSFVVNATYSGTAALDLLNCYNVVSPFASYSLPRTDLELARVAYGNSSLNTGYLETVGDLISSGDLDDDVKNAIMRHNTLKYVKLNESAVAPSKVRASDAGYDLTLIRKIKQSGDVTFYGTGLAMMPPDGYYLQLVPRSSISKTDYILANNIGIIDPTYRGEIIVALRKVSGDPNAELELPCRMVQVIPAPINHFDISLVDNLVNTSRDSGGFGSTGK